MEKGKKQTTTEKKNSNKHNTKQSSIPKVANEKKGTLSHKQ